MLGAVFGIAVWCGGFLLLDGPIDFYLYRKDVERLALPPKTTLVDRQSGFGLQVGNGNHCDYIVRLLISTELSRAELETYYLRHTVPSVPNSSEGVPVGGSVFVPAEYPNTDALPNEWTKIGGSKGMYIVEYFDSTEAWIDPRCS